MIYKNTNHTFSILKHLHLICCPTKADGQIIDAKGQALMIDPRDALFAVLRHGCECFHFLGQKEC